MLFLCFDILMILLIPINEWSNANENETEAYNFHNYF